VRKTQDSGLNFIGFLKLFISISLMSLNEFRVWLMFSVQQIKLNTKKGREKVRHKTIILVHSTNQEWSIPLALLLGL
jgi:hypothetical protein